MKINKVTLNKNTLKKIAFILLAIFIFRISIIWCLNYINIKFTDYIEIKNNIVLIDELKDNSIKTLVLKDNLDLTNSFFIKSFSKMEISILYEDTSVPYSLYVNNNCKIQNYDKYSETYSEDIAYNIFPIKKDDYKKVNDYYLVEIKFDKNKKIDKDSIFLLAKTQVLRKNSNYRIIYNSFMLFCFFAIFIISEIFYRREKSPYLFIIFLIAIVSLFKTLISGEIMAFTSMINVDVLNYFFLEKLTNIINIFLYQIAIYIMYKYNFQKKYICAYFIFLSVFSFQYIFLDNRIAFLIVHFSSVFLITYMDVFAYIRKIPYSKIFIISYSIFSASIFYKILLIAGYLKRGYFSNFLYSPQIGSIIYVFGFLIVAILNHFDRMKYYEKKNKEYERINFLRGVGHDLKLPLSIIKLNNQMLEKYQITDEEKNLYTKTSLDAISELEKMTDNISSYVGVGNIINKDFRTSIREGFEKLENQYYSYNNYNSKKFTVLFDENDWILKINPIFFQRMLYNLVDNSFKYTKENGEIEISYKISKKIIITIKDNGIGMEKHAIKKIFEPFYRIENSRSSEGLGIGLMVVKDVVDSLNGNIEIESKIKIGTKIVITIPK